MNLRESKTEDIGVGAEQGYNDTIIFQSLKLPRCIHFYKYEKQS